MKAHSNLHPDWETRIHNDDIRREYRTHLAGVLKLVKRYRGENQQREVILDHLVKLETWMREVFGEGRDIIIPLHVEQQLSMKMLKGKDWSVQRILGFVQERYVRWLERTLESNEEKGLIISEMDGVFLPPGNMPVYNGDGKHHYEELQLQQRLQQLLELLHKHGIFSDEVIIIRGRVHDWQMRQVPYTLVEIPKLSKQVLVCNEVGEATFVMRKILDRNLFLNTDKETLQKEWGGVVKKVIYRDYEKWADQLIQLLFDDGVVGAKVDVREVESLRQEIIRLYPTPEDWAAMTVNELRKLDIFGMKDFSLSTKFGFKGYPSNSRSNLLAFGRLIYGEADALRELTPEEVKAEILRRVQSPKKWARMRTKAKHDFKVQGNGLKSIARMFGMVGEYSNGNQNSHLALGRILYGEGHDILRDVTPEIVREDIKKRYPTPEDWIGMGNEEKKNFKLPDRGFGLKLQYIAGLFGVIGTPRSNSKYFKILGQKIYGKCDVLKVDEKEWTRKEVIADILEQCPTASDWASMGAKERTNFHACGMGLKSIATLLGLSTPHGQNPVNYKYYFFKLGQLVYGECSELHIEEKQEYSLEEIKAELLNVVGSPEEWVSLYTREKSGIRIFNMGLTKLSSLFGLVDDPIKDSRVFLEFGRILFGDHPSFEYSAKEIKELRKAMGKIIKKKKPRRAKVKKVKIKSKKRIPSRDEIIEQVKKEITVDEWIKLDSLARRNLSIFDGSMKMTAIARIMEMDVSPLSSMKNCLDLGRLIFGNQAIEDALKRVDKELLESILQQVPTASEWAAMITPQKQAFSACGIKLNAIAKKFGIDGNPVGYRSVHLKLGRKIYGDDPAFNVEN